MRNYSVFDIIGPIMIGPSSSHTAGAARLGAIARAIAGNGDIKKVNFYLHGSFAETYRGHGTDRALAAGILGMKPWDDRLKDSMEIAQELGITLKYIPIDLGDVHPNTVRIEIFKENGQKTIVQGSSIGGGSIEITEIDGDSLAFTGEYPTILIKHTDIPGMVAKVTNVLYDEKANIAFMKVYRSAKGREATMVFEMDNEIHSSTIKKIEEIPNVLNVKLINVVVEGD